MLQSVVMSYSHQRIAFLFESLLSVLQCVAVSYNHQSSAFLFF